ncbi:hypothetical protein AA313_de0205105 [Arthrobotrys entomopaga]|nr:hypothetical protein AA313_de0205105 [Arthrobotrys entomopaga]
MADEDDLKNKDNFNLYLFTSLSAGSTSLYTGFAVLDRILKAHRIPFKTIDVATNDAARSIWMRRKGTRQKEVDPDYKERPQELPALIKNGQVIGDFKEIEQWNEWGELKQRLDSKAKPAAPLSQTATTSTVDKKPEEKQETQAPPAAASILASAAAAAVNKKKEEKKEEKKQEKEAKEEAKEETKGKEKEEIKEEKKEEAKEDKTEKKEETKQVTK